MAIKEIMLPNTENKPKSLTPNALRAKRVVNKEQTEIANKRKYKIAVLYAIALFVFSCIENK